MFIFFTQETGMNSTVRENELSLQYEVCNTDIQERRV